MLMNCTIMEHITSLLWVPVHFHDILLLELRCSTKAAKKMAFVKKLSRTHRVIIIGRFMNTWSALWNYKYYQEHPQN